MCSCCGRRKGPARRLGGRCGGAAAVRRLDYVQRRCHHDGGSRGGTRELDGRVAPSTRPRTTGWRHANDVRLPPTGAISGLFHGERRRQWAVSGDLTETGAVTFGPQTNAYGTGNII